MRRAVCAWRLAVSGATPDSDTPARPGRHRWFPAARVAQDGSPDHSLARGPPVLTERAGGSRFRARVVTGAPPTGPLARRTPCRERRARTAPTRDRGAPRPTARVDGGCGAGAVPAQGCEHGGGRTDGPRHPPCITVVPAARLAPRTAPAPSRLIAGDDDSFSSPTVSIPVARYGAYDLLCPVSSASRQPTSFVAEEQRRRTVHAERGGAMRTNQ